eukprot:gene23599-biopygen8880
MGGTKRNVFFFTTGKPAGVGVKHRACILQGMVNSMEIPRDCDLPVASHGDDFHANGHFQFSHARIVDPAGMAWEGGVSPVSFVFVCPTADFLTDEMSQIRVEQFG